MADSSTTIEGIEHDILLIIVTAIFILFATDLGKTVPSAPTIIPGA